MNGLVAIFIFVKASSNRKEKLLVTSAPVVKLAFDSYQRVPYCFMVKKA
jgi:hypothetical protein